MKIRIFQVDAFTDELFHGNPAAVCPLDRWPDDALLQAIAAENNLSETAFLVSWGAHFELRWFTPTMEVDLCGHATLASAHVIFEHIHPGTSIARFQTKSGILEVERRGDLLVMEFPARPGKPCEAPEDLVAGLGAQPREVLFSRDYLAVFDSSDEVAALKPDMNRLLSLDGLGVIATAPGKICDFISRFFAPKAGVPEDPVTGSAHCTLIPYWAERLGKKELDGFQISARGGKLYCADLGERVGIGGRAVTYLDGFINV